MCVRLGVCGVQKIRDVCDKGCAVRGVRGSENQGCERLGV